MKDWIELKFFDIIVYEFDAAILHPIAVQNAKTSIDVEIAPLFNISFWECDFALFIWEDS